MAFEWEKIKEDPTKEYKILGQELLALKGNLNLQEDIIAELTTARNELKARLEASEKKISNLESALKEKDEKITSLEENLRALKKQHEELEDSVSNKEAEIQRLTEDISTKTTKISELENKIPELETQISTKDSEMENLKKDMTEKASHDENKINNLQSQLEALQQEITTNEESLREKNEAIAELNKKIGALHTEIEALTAQIPKKPVFAKAEEVLKGASCPNCGIPTYEEYRTVDGRRQLIRKYCSVCGWRFVEKPEITVALQAEVPREVKKRLKIFMVQKDGIVEESALDSRMVAIIADPAQAIIWIWRGANSDRFEYAGATEQATKIKNELYKIPHARIERVEEGNEPQNFPRLRR